jgi:hypothetical protein
MPTRPHDLPGYDFGTDRAAHSPVTLDELRQLERTSGLSAEDRRWLAMAGEVLAPQAEDMVTAWRTQIGEQPYLAEWFRAPDGTPDERYKAAVKPRFVQWVIDVCTRPYDQAWLDYQEEIGLRHTPTKKNATDRVSAPPLVPLRYLVAFTAVVVTTARDFLAKSDRSPEDVELMHAAWTKAVLLTLALWVRPYTRDELW